MYSAGSVPYLGLCGHCDDGEVAQLEPLHIAELWQLLAPAEVVLVHAAREQLQQLVGGAVLRVALQLTRQRGNTKHASKEIDTNWAAQLQTDVDGSTECGYGMFTSCCIIIIINHTYSVIPNSGC